MSHRDKKKIKQMRRNDYDLREVYSFETVSQTLWISADFDPKSLKVITEFDFTVCGLYDVDWNVLEYVQ